jgi:hypothetical protein
MRESERDVHFDIDGIGVDSKYGSAPQHGQQRATSLQEAAPGGTTAETRDWRGFSAGRAARGRNFCDVSEAAGTQI